MKCPHCNNEIKKAIQLGENPAKVDGCPMVYLYCSEFSISDKGVFRKLTEADIVDIKRAGFWGFMLVDQNNVRNNNRHKN